MCKVEASADHSAYQPVISPKPLPHAHNRDRSSITRSYSTHHTNKPGWSHAWVLHGPEGSAVVSLNRDRSSAGTIVIVTHQFYPRGSLSKQHLLRQT